MPLEPVVIDAISGQEEAPPGNQGEKEKEKEKEAEAEAEADLDDELDSLLSQDLSTLRRTAVAPALDVEVSTVSRQKSTIGRTAAAVYVVDQDMIRRSGYRSVPELLRLVPGLQVAKIDGNKWSIGARGFGGRYANTLLVQIDGRTVYTPLFGGTFWDVQDIVLDNIERIEVVRGPGATVWGANAVNGVINIISKSSDKTHGTFVEAGGGTLDRSFGAARLGGRTANGVDWRGNVKWVDRGTSESPTGLENDFHHLGSAGFRNDFKTNSGDTFTFQGNYYNGESGNTHVRPLVQTPKDVSPLVGGEVIGRWTRVYDEDTDRSIQFYYDHTSREEIDFQAKINNFDIDFQDRFPIGQRNNFIWGLAYRNTWDHLTNDSADPLIFAPQEKMTVERYSAFAQNEYAIVEDKAYFTIGSKLSHDTFARWQVQPSARLLYLPNERSAIWGSVSRAVRTPTRAERSIHFRITDLPSPFPANTPFMLFGGDSAVTMDMMAYEIGYRCQPTDQFSWDAAVFYNVYDNFLSDRIVQPGGFAPPFAMFSPDGTAHSYGVEVTGQLQVTDHWQLNSSYSFARIDFDNDPIGNPTTANTRSNEYPRNQARIFSHWNVTRDWTFDAITRYVDVLPIFGTPSYLQLDLRAGWMPNRNLEVSIAAQNLLDRSQPEYGTNQYTGELATEVPRSVYGMIQVRY
ncbi:MAG: TonB-dependent receptor [Rubripirellula sp.]